MANITVQVQSLLNTAVYNSYTIDNGQTVAQLKTAVNSDQGFDSAWYDLVLGNVLTEGSTLASLGIVSSTQLRAHNKIGRLATRELRQVAKLELARLDRAASGQYSVYDIATLPTQFSNNVIVDNANADGLLLGRPWLGVELLLAPETLAEAIPSNVLVNLESWYDGSDGATFVPNNPNDGDTFTQWTDKSSFAHNANSIGGATTRASYQTNEQNTLSVVRFDGNDGLSINPYASLASAPALTVFAVMKMTATTGNPNIFVTNGGATGLTYDSTAGKFVAKAAGGVGTSTVVNDASAFHIHTFAYDGTQTTNANSLKYRYDKTDITLSFTGTVGDTTSASNTTLYVGNNNGANFYTGDIAEFLIFTHALTSTEIQNVENYLSTKWDLNPVIPFTFTEIINAAGASIVETNVGPLTIEAKATSFQVFPIEDGYIKVNSTTIKTTSQANVSRGHTLAVISPAGATVGSITTYDTFESAPGDGGAAGRTALTSALNAVVSGNYIALVSWDACSFDATLRSALNTGYGTTLTTTWAATRYSHIVIAKKL